MLANRRFIANGLRAKATGDAKYMSWCYLNCLFPLFRSCFIVATRDTEKMTKGSARIYLRSRLK